MIARQGLYPFTPLKCVGLRYANRTSANAHFVAFMKDLFGEHNYPRKHANHTTMAAAKRINSRFE